MTSTLKADRVEINNNASTRAFHHDGTNAGFLGTDGGWRLYENNSGQVWTSNYGWLHNYFFSGIANCGGPKNVINCYGSGNVNTGVTDELLDQGSYVQIRSVNNFTNCNCACSTDV